MNMLHGCKNLKWSTAVVFLLLITAAVFELHPAVKIGRDPVPDVVHVGAACDCHCIMEKRPWYSKFNYWFWLWITVVPVIVFSVGPEALKWIRAFRTTLAIGISYILILLSIFLDMKIDDGPTVVSDGNFSLYHESVSDCFNVGSGAKIAFALTFGWAYAAVYTGWWDMVWYRYHAWSRKEASIKIERDILSNITTRFSFFTTIIIFIFAIILWIVIMIQEDL